MQKKVIFVDCFDTIILRTVPAEKTKYLWAVEMNKKYTEISAENFYKVFLSAEDALRNRGRIINDVNECNIFDIASLIYKRIKIYNLMKIISEKEFAKEVIDNYINVEKDVQYLNCKLMNKLKKYKQNGYKIFIVSDFYCGKEVLKQWLANLGVLDLFDNIYVSCDYMKTKLKGDLYTHILSENNISPDEVIMIGDSKHSDNIVPRSLGMTSKKLKDRNKYFCIKEKYKGINIPKDLKHIMKKNKTNSFSNYSFSLFVFIKRLINQLRSSNIKDVFFLSREGEFLKKIFDCYMVLFNINDIQSHYLQVSRNSILVASLEDIENETFTTVINETGWISINDFLTTLNFSCEEIKTIGKEINQDINTAYREFLKSEPFNQLKHNSTFINVYNNIRTEQRCSFEKYLNKFKVNFKKDGLHIVDVGWKGTMQDLLNKFFAQSISITGYYIGYNGYAEEEVNSIKHGLLYSNSPYASDLESKIYYHNILDYEQILRASHNRVIGYIDNGIETNVVYDEASYDKEFYKDVIKDFQEEMFNKFQKICLYYKNNPNINIEKICQQVHIKMMRFKTHGAYKFITSCRNAHYDSFSRIGFTDKATLSMAGYIKFFLLGIKFYFKLIFNKL